MANILSIVSIVSFVLAGICFLLAVFFWFRFNIPAVIGDLSGRTARKSIAKLREGNEKSGAKVFRPSATNSNRGKLTSTMPQTGGKKSSGLKTEKQEPVVQPLRGDAGVTEVLLENQAVAIDGTETALLMEEESATTSLLVDENGGETEPMAAQSPRQKKGKQLVMLDDVVLIHTDEVIG